MAELTEPGSPLAALLDATVPVLRSWRAWNDFRSFGDKVLEMSWIWAHCYFQVKLAGRSSGNFW